MPNGSARQTALRPTWAEEPFVGTLCAQSSRWLIHSAFSICRYLISFFELRISSRHHGQNQRVERCTQRHQQRRKSRQASSPHPTQLESHRQVLKRDAKTRYVEGDLREFTQLQPGMITRQWFRTIKPTSRSLPFKFPADLNSARILHIFRQPSMGSNVSSIATSLILSFQATLVSSKRWMITDPAKL